jgi:hypothetical protein
MSYFTATSHAQVITDPTVFPQVYAVESSRFLADLGSAGAAEHSDFIKLGFAATFAYDLKPYGQSGAITLDECLSAAALDCDNYCALTFHLWKLLGPALWPDLSPSTTDAIHYVGWNGGPIGNHAQLSLNRPGVGNWIVDPTVGALLMGHDFDWVAMGQPAVGAYLKHPASVQRLPDFTNQVDAALLGGGYRPSHLQYYYHRFDAFSTGGTHIDRWPTPQNVAVP